MDGGLLEDPVVYTNAVVLLKPRLNGSEKVGLKLFMSIIT
ncbi:hypothetical protein NIASO_05665 [Niabella soli DSM 19437]|uniref:Uncharacterized protein n=1 Tax=Niabella soli DSM 19437 TaxID=929713 RepID=W0F7J5_9BACT|nr:hypothetical protein NIASO_05665 [Niabella soli DSM 19437]